jgi:hypothetical protein
MVAATVRNLIEAGKDRFILACPALCRARAEKNARQLSRYSFETISMPKPERPL